jgi:hypothetical protein
MTTRRRDSADSRTPKMAELSTAASRKGLKDARER